MKKIISVVLVCMFFGNACAVTIKNTVGVGAATNMGKIRVSNIGTYGTPYTYSTVTHAGVLVTPGPVTLRACDTTVGDNQFCQGVMIAPGETQSVNTNGTVVIWAMYPNQSLMVKYAAPQGNGYLEFPKDFKDNPSDAKEIMAVPR